MNYFSRHLLGLLLLGPAISIAAADDWKLVWQDEFNTNGAPNPANWNYEQGFVRNKELQWYQPDNAVCTNGLLVIEARPQHKLNPRYRPGSNRWQSKREWIDYTSASLTTRGLQEFKYGKFEMRARIDTRLGSWPAFWTLGTERLHLGWPACGEIDIMEYYTGTVLANIMNRHGQWSTVKEPIVKHGGELWSKEFHRWTMEWDEQKIDLFLDGVRMNHLDLTQGEYTDPENPFHQPVYLILNQAIGATGGDPAQTKFPIRYEIDWVRVYQRAQPAAK